MERNRLMLENQQKKILQMKNKRQSIERGKIPLQKSIEGKKNLGIVIESKRIVSSSGKSMTKPPLHPDLKKGK